MAAFIVGLFMGFSFSFISFVIYSDNSEYEDGYVDGYKDGMNISWKGLKGK